LQQSQILMVQQGKITDFFWFCQIWYHPKSKLAANISS
jgi:hypothetical protein